jgi:hypothetical protein
MRLMKALMTIPPRFSLVRVALLAGALLACAAPSAHAAAWPGYGGDPGRSGNQPVDAGVVPLAPVWQRTAAGDQNVKTSIVTSAGSPATQRVIYGTSDGVVHFRRLSDGVPFGGADVGGDADVFGTQSATPGANGASVSFADTSTATGPGQLFAAHNDGAGIEIAHFNEADGSLVDEFAVPGTTTGMTIDSSLLATPAGADGARSLFFVAGGRLFKVAVANAGTPAASFGAVTSTADVDANPIASPTLLYLDVVGTPMAHIAIGTTDGFLRTYRTTNLAPGPSMDLKIEFGPPPTPPTITADDVMTPSVPVQPNGAIPGPGSPVDEAQFVYVAASGVFPFFPAGGDDTIAYKLHVVDGAFEFQFEFLPIPDTDPAPALSVSQLAEGDEPDDAEVLITTSTNLFLATTRDMDLTGEIDFDSDLVAGVDGFRQTTASVSGPLYYVTNDRGEQIVGRLSDGKTVTAGEFTRDAANAGADNGGVGQPAISRGYVQFAGPDGVFVYRNTDVTAPAVALTAPAAEATVSGTVTVAATASDARGIDAVEFFANGRSLATATTADSGDAFAAPGASFSISVDTDELPAGEYVLDAVATDGSGLSTVSDFRRIVVPARDGGPPVGGPPVPAEDTPPSVAFARPAAGALLSGSPTLSANASDDHGVASVRFLAGERVVCTDTTAPYECDYRLGADDVGRTTLVAVATDTAGQTGAALRTVRVSRFTPAFVSASTAPRRDRRRPFRFTTSGRVRLPSGLTRAQACGSGDVAVVVKAARKTISTRRVQLSRTCSYRSRVTFRPRNRFPRNRRLTVRVRFLGNAVLGPRRAEAVAVGTR